MFCESTFAESTLPLTYEAMWNATRSRAKGLSTVRVMATRFVKRRHHQTMRQIMVTTTMMMMMMIRTKSMDKCAAAATLQPTTVSAVRWQHDCYTTNNWRRGRGIVFDRFLCLFTCIFVSFFVSLLARLRSGPICMKFSVKVWSDHGTTWLHFWRCATRGRGLLCFRTTTCLFIELTCTYLLLI